MMSAEGRTELESAEIRYTTYECVPTAPGLGRAVQLQKAGDQCHPSGFAPSADASPELRNSAGTGKLDAGSPARLAARTRRTGGDEKGLKLETRHTEPGCVEDNRCQIHNLVAKQHEADAPRTMGGESVLWKFGADGEAACLPHKLRDKRVRLLRERQRSAHACRVSQRRSGDMLRLDVACTYEDTRTRRRGCGVSTIRRSKGGW